jgi:hypothetical protein
MYWKHTGLNFGLIFETIKPLIIQVDASSINREASNIHQAYVSLSSSENSLKLPPKAAITVPCVS